MDVVSNNDLEGHSPGVALFHKTERNRAIIVVKCATEMYYIAI